MFKIFGLKRTLLQTINSLEKELTDKVIDLENNIELLRNNVPELKEKKNTSKRTATKKSSVKKTTTRRKSTKKEVIPSDQTNK